MYLLGLTGGIGAGKSTVARRLVGLGAFHIDADLLARAAVEPGTLGLSQIVDAFGPEVLQADGSLNRSALGERAFADPNELARLNDIVHPRVQELARRRFEEVSAADTDAVVVYEVPLLVESGVEHPWNCIVTVEAPVDLRLQRLMDIRGMSAADAQSRISAQVGESERRAVADVVIDSGCSLEHTLAQVDALWADAPWSRVSGGA